MSIAHPPLPPPSGELQPRAASGRKSEAAISAAVGKHEEKRKPEVFSGHRKAEVARRVSRKRRDGRAMDSIVPGQMGQGTGFCPVLSTTPCIQHKNTSFHQEILPAGIHS